MEENTKKYKDNLESEKELLKIKKKYSIKYVLLEKLTEVYIVFLLIIIFSFYCKQVATGIFSIFVLIIVILLTLIFSKKSACETYIIFYENKIYYKRKFLFIDKEKTIDYKDVKTITFTQGVNWYERFWQKILKLGNIYIYPKNGNIIANGISLEIIENIDKVIKDVEIIFGDRMK